MTRLRTVLLSVLGAVLLGFAGTASAAQAQAQPDTAPTARWTCTAAGLTCEPCTEHCTNPTGSVEPDTPVAFDGRPSSDDRTFAIGRIVSHRWEFCDEQMTTVTGAQVSHRFARSGAYGVTLTVTDDEGRIDSKTLQIQVGRGGPQITGGPCGPTSRSFHTFTLKRDPLGRSFECRLSGSAAQPCGDSFTTGVLADGRYTFSVTSPAASPPTESTRSFEVDTRAPDTTIAGPAVTRDPRQAFTYGATEAGVGFECRLDAGAWAACTDLPALGDGAHTLRVRARDAAGNLDPTEAVKTFTVDTVAPAITIGGAATTGFTFTSSEPTGGFQCRLDGGAFGPCTSPQGYPGVGPGAHRLDVRAADAAGNEGMATRAFSLDGTPVGAAGSSTSPDGSGVLGGATGADVTAPVLSLSAARRTLTASARGGLRLTLGQRVEAVTGTLSLRTASRVLTRAEGRRRAVVVLASRSVRAAAGRAVAVQVTLTRAGRAALRRNRRLRVVATLRARDAAGNAATTTLRFTLLTPGR